MNDDNGEIAYLIDLVKPIVDKPNEVKVDRTVDERGVKLTLTVDKDDMGKIIGSKGKNASAIRAIVHAFGGQRNSKISVVIEDPMEHNA